MPDKGLEAVPHQHTHTSMTHAPATTPAEPSIRACLHPFLRSGAAAACRTSSLIAPLHIRLALARLALRPPTCRSSVPY